MKLEKEYWRKLIKEYEESGLSQAEFCSQQGIHIAQFKYRWRQEMGTNSKKERIAGRRIEAVPGFEAVSISETDSLASTEDRPRVICIQLPNQIRCEFPMPLSGTELGLLLKQLVALC
ncbi:MAG: hypothetical protein H0U73_03575 [Tatlockia sp.]|nr:hypothetical protein [Tatlockia sp.]